MFSYFGGKSKIARYYPHPRYPLIVEPFAGAAGYSMLHWRRDVLLNEIDPSIVAVWRWLQEIRPSDLDKLPIVLSGVAIPYVQPPAARRFLSLALVQGKGEPRRNAGWGPNNWRSHKNKLHRIQHWRIQCGNYTDCPDVEATWFIDPPYAGNTARHYLFNSQPPSWYHDLAEWCRSRHGQVIVCEQIGADWLPFRPMILPNFGQKGALHEVVWTNA